MSNYNRYRLSNIQYTSQKFGVNIFFLFYCARMLHFYITDHKFFFTFELSIPRRIMKNIQRHTCFQH